jgi:hypothetical protein
MFATLMSGVIERLDGFEGQVFAGQGNQAEFTFDCGIARNNNIDAIGDAQNLIAALQNATEDSNGYFVKIASKDATDKTEFGLYLYYDIHSKRTYPDGHWIPFPWTQVDRDWESFVRTMFQQKTGDNSFEAMARR